MAPRASVFVLFIAVISGVFLVAFAYSTWYWKTAATEQRRRLVRCERARERCEATQYSVDDVFRLALEKSKDYVPERFVREMAEQALQHDDGLLLLALITVESHFDPFAVSSAGAVGCGQVKPSYWDKFLRERGIVRSKRDYRDPRKCVDIAAAVLDKLLLDTKDDLHQALVVYQCGPSNKACWRTAGRQYANAVLREYGDYVYRLRRR